MYVGPGSRLSDSRSDSFHFWCSLLFGIYIVEKQGGLQGITLLLSNFGHGRVVQSLINNIYVCWAWFQTSGPFLMRSSAYCRQTWWLTWHYFGFVKFWPRLCRIVPKPVPRAIGSTKYGIVSWLSRCDMIIFWFRDLCNTDIGWPVPA